MDYLDLPVLHVGDINILRMLLISGGVYEFFSLCVCVCLFCGIEEPG